MIKFMYFFVKLRTLQILIETYKCYIICLKPRKTRNNIPLQNSTPCYTNRVHSIMSFFHLLYIVASHLGVFEVKASNQPIFHPKIGIPKGAFLLIGDPFWRRTCTCAPHMVYSFSTRSRTSSLAHSR